MQWTVHIRRFSSEYILKNTKIIDHNNHSPGQLFSYFFFLFLFRMFALGFVLGPYVIVSQHSTYYNTTTSMKLNLLTLNFHIHIYSRYVKSKSSKRNCTKFSFISSLSSKSIKYTNGIIWPLIGRVHRVYNLLIS